MTTANDALRLAVPKGRILEELLPLLARTFSKDFFRDRIIEVIHAHLLCLRHRLPGYSSLV